MDFKEIMKLERNKAIIKAIGELEISLNTFYNNDLNYDELDSIYRQLKQYKETYLD